EDVADVLLRSLEVDAKNQLLNLGTGEGTTILEVVKLSGEALGVEPNLKFEPERPGEIANFVAETSKLAETIGFVPETSLEDGLRRTFDWLRANEG
ncbi:MAG: hypothetical protein KAW09_06905, partial [Thermoplasmata archaeon]|nr:hypothetical protein [Thermoplasmata archaeon]